MEVIKKNIVLFIILFMAVIFALFLGFMVFTQHHKMTESMEKVRDIVSQIEQLNKQRPTPSKENLKRIEADVKEYEKKLQEVQNLFGHPYRKGLAEFAKVLGTNEMKLINDFREYWLKQNDEKLSRYEILNNFFKDSDKEKVKKAMEAFQTEIKKVSIVETSVVNPQDYLLAALGLPITMTDIECKRFMSEMQSKLEKYMLGNIEEKDGEKIKDIYDKKKQEKFNAGVEKFTFGDFESRMPQVENIPIIIKQWLIIEDIVKRLVQSKIQKINMFSKTSLYGSEAKGYMRYTYRLELVGTLDSLRSFTNSLIESYKENRIYLIKDISLNKVIDEGRLLIDGAIEEVDYYNPKAGMGEEGAEQREFELSKPVHKRKGYGKILLGINNLAKMSIEFEYIIYVADELPLK